ncbi:unnamed protein product [Meloidogyne enterolobii]|uniref:Uncharacterized protein n=1 Tax=Meloidogyne enterolobii TaxID=390850 RepID=A0ACB0YJ91_MELEN
MAKHCPPRKGENNGDNCNIEIILECFPSVEGTTLSNEAFNESSEATETNIGCQVNTPPPESAESTNVPQTNFTNQRPCRAILILELIRIKILRLNIKQQVLFDVCINEIEAILLDVKLSIEVKVIKIAFKLKLFFLNNPDIELLICLEEIKGFGRVFEFIFAGLEFNAANLEAAIKSLDNEGKSQLSIALESAISFSKCNSKEILQLQLLIKFFKRICFKLDDDWKIERKHAYIAIVLKSFLSNNASSCLAKEIFNAQIEGFGTIQEYLTFCDLYVILSKIGPIVLNGNVNVNILIKSLNLAINSKISVNASILIEAKNFVNVLINFFKSEIDVFLRFKFVSAQFELLSKPCHDLLYKVLIVDIDTTVFFYQVIALSDFCIDSNITISTQTVSEDFAECCKIDHHNNTDLLIALDVDLPPLLNAVEKLSFKSFRNSIFNCIHKLNPHNHKAAHQCCIPFIKNNLLNKLLPKELFSKIILWPVFVQINTVIEFGNLSGFCGC